MPLWPKKRGVINGCHMEDTNDTNDDVVDDVVGPDDMDDDADNEVAAYMATFV